MRSTDLLRFNLQLLLRHRFRSLMILLALAIGVAAVNLLTGLGEGAKMYVLNQFSLLGNQTLIMLPGKKETSGGMPPITGESPRDITLQDAAAIARLPGVAAVAPLLVGITEVRFNARSRDVVIAGTSSDYFNIRQLAVHQGQPLPALTLRSPNELFRSDYSNTDGRPDLTYSRRAWSVLLPWDWVKPGLSLSLTDEQGRNGQLAAEGIEFAAPAELVLHTIRVGMLTAPPKSNSHWLSLEPVRAATDYFQTIPVARITAAQYEDVQFNRVMVGSGAIYDVDGASHNPPEPTVSPSVADVYSGDMRGDTRCKMAHKVFWQWAAKSLDPDVGRRQAGQ